MKDAPMSFKTEAALAINYVGVTVPDIHAATEWYGEVLGFRCIKGPYLLEVMSHSYAEIFSSWPSASG